MGKKSKGENEFLSGIYLPSGMVLDLNWSWFGRNSLEKTTKAGGRYTLRAPKSLRRKRTPPPFEKNRSTIVISTSGRSKASSFSNHHTRKLTSKGQYVRWEDSWGFQERRLPNLRIPRSGGLKILEVNILEIYFCYVILTLG